MNILPISMSEINRQNYSLRNIKKSNDKSREVYENAPSIYYPTFGYCEPHMKMMRTLNESITKSINKNYADYINALKVVADYKSKLSKIEEVQRKAAQLITQYASYEYSVAEVIPSYALECSSETMNAIKQTGIFDTPKDILLTIANIPKLDTKPGIDKYTGKEYTPEQTRKSRANSQLYSTVIMLDLLDKKISSSELTEDEKLLVMNMRASVFDTISSIYGKDAYSRIQKLKMMGKDASIEDKRASLRLLEEFDQKAKDLDFGEDFYNNLNKLLKHSETFGTDIQEAFTERTASVPVVKLSYHTHPQNVEHIHPHEHTHEHTHEYSHEYMHEHGIAHTHDEKLIKH